MSKPEKPGYLIVITSDETDNKKNLKKLAKKFRKTFNRKVNVISLPTDAGFNLNTVF